MKRRFANMKFFDTYLITANVHDFVSLNDPDSYSNIFDTFWDDEAIARFLPPFPRFSRLHELNKLIIDGMLLERLDDLTVDSLVNHPDEHLWLEEVFERYQISHKPFDKWLSESGIPISDLEEEHLHEYVNILTNEGSYEELLKVLSTEAFFLLFLNRGFLHKFNQLMANQLASTEVACLSPENQSYMSKDGVLRRVSIPKWVRRAVFFRDRGLCVFCHCDLTGTVSTMPDKNFDHIVALANGGVNDVTNIQLVCGNCNRVKGACSGRTSDEYEQWY